MSTTGYILNNFLPQQYLWDGTCGYHAINNTLNIIYSLNKYHIINYNEPYTFNSFINSNEFYNKHNPQITELSRNYYIYLNKGLKSTYNYDLININNLVNKNNKLYFWDLYSDKVKIKSLINNNIPGIFGIIIFHNEWWVKHWYGIVIDINYGTKKIYIIDNFSIIWSDKIELINIFKELNLNVEWYHSYNKPMIYLYKIYQALLFIFVYFIIIYGIILLLVKYNKIK